MCRPLSCEMLFAWRQRLCTCLPLSSNARGCSFFKPAPTRDTWELSIASGCSSNSYGNHCVRRTGSGSFRGKTMQTQARAVLGSRILIRVSKDPYFSGVWRHTSLKVQDTTSSVRCNRVGLPTAQNRNRHSSGSGNRLMSTHCWSQVSFAPTPIGDSMLRFMGVCFLVLFTQTVGCRRND